MIELDTTMSQNTSHDRFMTILEWLMSLQERHPKSLHFGLIHICFHDPRVLGDAYGARDAAQMLSEFLARLRDAFRKTDLAIREGVDFWMLVPYTNPETVMDKVAELVELASQSGLDIVERDIAIFSFPEAQTDDVHRCATPEELLAYLKRNRDVAQHWGSSSQAGNPLIPSGE